MLSVVATLNSNYTNYPYDYNLLFDISYKYINKVRKSGILSTLNQIFV